MGDDKKDSKLSIGCVICASNFVCTDDCVVTTCGHLYHKTCLDKWMHSLRELNPSGRDACPDCRTIIDDEADTKPVYPNYTSPDDLELTKLKKKNELLAHQMVLVKKENYNLKVKLGSEKEKNGRLQTRNEKIVNEMMAVLNNAQKLKVKTTCARCEANATKGKTIMKSKQQSKTVKAVSSSDVQKITKQLRNRELTYTI